MNSSFGLALRARRAFKLPLLLDVEEWELGLLGSSICWEFRHAPKNWLVRPNSLLYTRFLDRKIRRADAITVTNFFLQGRYGGVLIPHARDETVFRPVEDGAANRTVLFLGSIRPHKGLDVLLDAWPLVGVPDATLRIVGTPLDDRGVRPLREKAGNGVRWEGYVPHERVPQVMGSASVFVIPQLSDPASVGQLPTKLIEAMAMGLPIVASDVGDIPHWLSGGGGLVVEPGNRDALAGAIRRLLLEPTLAASLRQAARMRFLRDASFRAVRPRLIELVGRTIAAGALR